MFATKLQVIHIADDRVVLKRGISEMLLTGPGVESVVTPLIPLLDGSRSRAEIVESFPEPLREEVDDFLGQLLARRFISEEPEPSEPEAGMEALQPAFWWNFGDAGRAAPERLVESRVLVVGANLIARSLVRSLLESGVGEVTVVSDPLLDNRFVAFDPEIGSQVAADRLRRIDAVPGEDDLAGFSLIAAASDFGLARKLLDLNQLAVRLEKGFLPAWVQDLVGYVGPLTHPYQSACLRCYETRRDSNDSDFEAAAAIRMHTAADPQALGGGGLLPPMTGAVGEIAAMEAVKSLAEFSPCDAVGRVIEINLVSFKSAVRRVLKIPRCPHCSELMRYGAKALVAGPLIPQHEE